MEIDRFVKTTLLQIGKGVREAQEELRAQGVLVNPFGHQRADLPASGAPIASTPDDRMIFAVDFDIAVTVRQVDGEEAGGRVEVLSLVRAGGEVRRDREHGETSRVQFRVPIAYSQDPVSTEQLRQHMARFSRV